MNLSFGNLLGFWALLGIPAVLLIHFLQRRSRPLVISTLFLLEQMQQQSVGGNRIERLRTSVPLWLQLLSVMLIAWLLTQPRWMRTQTVQRIAIVLDSSASMSVFKQAAAEQIEAALADLTSLITTTEYMLLETRDSTRLGTGTDRAQLLKILADWEPFTGTHDPSPALRLARSTVGTAGLVIFVTDHTLTQPPPYDARLLSVGSPQENCGFAGFAVETADDGQLVWKTLAQNYGNQLQKRQWWLEIGDRRTAPTELILEPQKSVPLQSPFPANTEQCTLVMQADGFTLDDRLPMVAPVLKQLSIWIPQSDNAQDNGSFYRQVFGSFANVRIVPAIADADIEIGDYDPLDPALPSKSACIFAQDPRPRSDFLNGQIVSASNPLINGLNWQGLLCRESIRIPPRENDDVLLWQGERPLIFVRRLAGGNGTTDSSNVTTDGSQLYFNFDLRKSNAQRLPAFAILLHRFLTAVRDNKIASEARNYEVGQTIELTRDRQPGAPALITRFVASTQSTSEMMTSEVPANRQGPLRAPSRVGFFEIAQGQDTLLRAATQFADTREADFRSAQPANDLRGAQATIIERHSQTDGHWRLWLLAMLALLLISWHFLSTNTAARNSQSGAIPSPK
ncbi:MAG: BatA domain-containing protein [Verrucomicrobia bacterium]|nr:BatA domain-containing protein [Verrucomicrobiota bacterium]